MLPPLRGAEVLGYFGSGVWIDMPHSIRISVGLPYLLTLQHGHAVFGDPGGRRRSVLEFRLVVGTAASGAHSGLPRLRVCVDGEGPRAQGASGKGRAHSRSFHRRDRADSARGSAVAWS